MPAMTLEGKNAIITGATSGIGLAVLRRFVEAGAYVIALGRNRAGLAEVEAMLGSRGEAIACDMSDLDHIAETMTTIAEKHGWIDVLAINAGVSHAPDIGDLSPKAYARLMDVNCRGAIFTFVHALPLLAKGASVIFTGSVAGRKGQPGDALYAGSKGFIRAFARSAGTDPDLLARRIRVNVVSPGPVETPLTQAATQDEAIRAYVETLIPMKRWGRAQEVAEAMLFLASDASSFTTGADLTVDGGMAHV